MPNLQVKFKPSLQANSLAEQAANEEINSDNSESLRKIYSDLMDQLEIDGIIKDKISTVGQKIILEKKRAIKKDLGASDEEIKKLNIGSYWFKVASQKNFTDPHYSHGVAPQGEREIVPLSKYEIENQAYLTLIKNTKNFLSVAENKLKDNHFMSLLDDDSKVTLALHDWQAQLDIAESHFDHKEKIPENTQHILLHALGTMSSNNDAADEYFRLREKAHKLTGKQLSKYRSGIIKTKLAIFNPQDRITAILWNYFGVQCVSCKSWRVLQVSQRADTTKVNCLDCNNTFHAATTSKCNYCGFPFFEEDLGFIKKEKTCPNCKQELPEYLINYILN